MCEQYNAFFQTLINDREKVFADPKAGSYFMRLISPAQIGDEKSDAFVMPFKLEVV